MSRLCLGGLNFGWHTPEKESFDILNAAFSAGINFIDTANSYSRWANGLEGGESESIIGRWLKTQNRRDLIIATKFGQAMWDSPTGEGHSRKHIIHAVEDSLKRLQTDYIDLYQVHWPRYEASLDELLSALDFLVRQGMVLYIGASNFPAWYLMKALWLSDKKRLSRFVTIQPEYSIFARSSFEQELAAACLDQNVAVIPYSPLASGFATGKYTRENHRPDSRKAQGLKIKRFINNNNAYDVLDAMKDLASSYNVPLAHVALAWLLSKKPVSSAIIGARTLAQLTETLTATELELNSEELIELDKVSIGF